MTRQQTHGMKRQDFYSDRAIRRMFDATPVMILEAKNLDRHFEDVRFCPLCEKFFDGNLFISTIEFEERAEFVCARCAALFGSKDDVEKVNALDLIDRRFIYLSRDLRLARYQGQS